MDRQIIVKYKKVCVFRGCKREFETTNKDKSFCSNRCALIWFQQQRIMWEIEAENIRKDG